MAESVVLLGTQKRAYTSFEITEIEQVDCHCSRDCSFFPSQSELETTAPLETDMSSPAAVGVSSEPYAGHSTRPGSPR